jgi:hypothetical protein
MSTNELLAEQERLQSEVGLIRSGGHLQRSGAHKNAHSAGVHITIPRKLARFSVGA